MKPITVGEAIEILQRYNKDMLLLVDGYEKGFDIPLIKEELVVEMPSHHLWEGAYASFKEEGGPVAGYMNAVVFGRPSPNE